MSDESTKGPDRRQKVRRVRVIEYIDDVDERDDGTDAGPDEDDLREVLAEADAADATDTKPSEKRRSRVAADDADDDDERDDDERDDVEQDDDDVAGEAKAEAGERRRSARAWETRAARPRGTTTRTTRGPRRVVRHVASSPRLTSGLVVALVLVLAGVAFWQWRSAAALAAEQDDRRAVAKVAGEYGNTAFSYTAATYQQSIQANLRLLGGDLLAGYKSNTQPNLPKVFAKNPQLQMSSKIKGVYVGDVNGDIATAVILVDVMLKTPDGTNDGSNALLRLGLKRENGAWKITDQKASGQADGQSAGDLSGLTGGAPGASPSPSKSEDKKD